MRISDVLNLLRVHNFLNVGVIGRNQLRSTTTNRSNLGSFSWKRNITAYSSRSYQFQVLEGTILLIFRLAMCNLSF